MNEENALELHRSFKAVHGCGFCGLEKRGSYAFSGGRFGAGKFRKPPY